MKKHLLNIALILLFIGALVFNYLGHGIPAVFFSDLGNVVYPAFTYFGDKDLLLTYVRGWNSMLSFPFYLANANANFIGPLLFFFAQDIWLKVQLAQVLQIILAAFGAYALSWRIVRDKKIAATSAFLYATTPLFFSMLNGHNSLAWSYVLLPVVVIFIEKTVKDKKTYLALVTGILLSLVTFVSALQFIYYIGIPVFVYLIIRAGIQFIPDVKASFYFVQVKYVMLIGIISLVFASFFLIPTFFEFYPYTGLNKESARKNVFVTNFYTPSLREAAGLQSKEQIVSVEFGYTLDTLPARFTQFYIALSLLALASAGIVAAKKIKFSDKFYYWPFFVAGAVSFGLSFGKYTFFYRILDEHLPYFWTIRTPGRFLIFYALFVSLFASLTIWKLFSWLFSKIKKQRVLRVVEPTVLTLIAVFILYNATFFGQTLWTLKTLQAMDEHYPDVREVQEKLAQLDPENEYRALDLIVEKDGNPHHLKAYSAGHRTFANAYDILWRFKDDKNLARILGMLNVKYVLTAPWPPWPEAYTTPFPPLEKRLYTDPYFRMVYTAPSGIKIWENQSALPQTYVATPIFAAGSPSAMSRVLDIVPKEINPAVFFADQIQDQTQKEEIINRSAFVFIDRSTEQRPPYLDQVDFGLALNNNFYLNPQDYRNDYQQILDIARTKNKPVIEYKKQESVAGLNILSLNSSTQDLKIETMENTARIVLQKESKYRLEPERFNEPAEIVYKITSAYPGTLKITVDAISLFDNNYVQLLTSSNNSSYREALVLQGDNEYPEFYSGSLWIDMDSGNSVFLKLRLFADEKTSRKIYDSRVENFMIDFIRDSSYNYNSLNSDEFSRTMSASEKLVLQKNQPGKSVFTFVSLPLESRALVASEIYTPQWAVFYKEQKIKSLPVNLFENGFLATFKNENKVTVIYTMSFARWLGLLLSLGAVAVTLIVFKKGI